MMTTMPNRHNIPAAEARKLEDETRQFGRLVHASQYGAHEVCDKLSGPALLRMALAFYLFPEDDPYNQQHVLLSLWNDHGRTVRVEKPRWFLMELFRSARYPVPKDTPETVTIWRGGRVDNPADLVSGYSWTMNREQAAGYAVLPAANIERSLSMPPCLVSAEVPRDDMIYFYNSDAMRFFPPTWAFSKDSDPLNAEVFPMDVPAAFEVDEGLADWIPIGIKRQAVIQEKLASFVADGRYPFERRQEIRWFSADRQGHMTRDRHLYPYWPSTMPADVL